MRRPEPRRAPQSGPYSGYADSGSPRLCWMSWYATSRSPPCSDACTYEPYAEHPALGAIFLTPAYLNGICDLYHQCANFINYRECNSRPGYAGNARNRSQPGPGPDRSQSTPMAVRAGRLTQDVNHLPLGQNHLL